MIDRARGVLVVPDEARQDGKAGASADVHVSGRSAFEFRANTAPENAVQLLSVA
jgi:hypothetical protein